jgi:parallel beta-helix repeat protein
MGKKLTILMCTFIFLVPLSCLEPCFAGAEASDWPPVHNLETGLNYTAIQEAIDALETLAGHTIFVEEGTYYEHLVVSKPVSLIGQNRETTIIDGNMTDDVIRVTQDSVNITGFTIRRSGRTLFNAGVALSNRWHCNVSGNRIVNNLVGTYGSPRNAGISSNIVVRNHIGIDINWATHNTVSGNLLMANNCSLHLYYANANTIVENNMTSNWRPITLGYSRDNRLYHNEFRNNTEPILILAQGYSNLWDDGYPSGGNYWADYSDVDLYGGAYQNETGGDEIWDHSYVIDEYNQDNYPLIPEFPPTVIFALFMMATSLAALAWKSRVREDQQKTRQYHRDEVGCTR